MANKPADVLLCLLVQHGVVSALPQGNTAGAFEVVLQCGSGLAGMCAGYTCSRAGTAPSPPSSGSISTCDQSCSCAEQSVGGEVATVPSQGTSGAS